jgi:hypothetical protein
MVELIIGGYPQRAFGQTDEPWLVDAGDLHRVPDVVLRALRASGEPLVLDLRLGVIDDDNNDIPVIRNPVGLPVDSPAITVSEQFGTLVLTQAHQLTAAVATIAKADGPILLRSGPGEQTATLVAALTLLAAGASVPSVVEDSSGDAASGILHALWVLDRFNGVECYLLRHGLTIEHFYSLRAKLFTEPDEP